MCIFKILPLMCLVATTFAIGVPLCRPNHDSAESKETCLCATGSPTIINKIDPEGFGIERLVIFVYRKPSTGEIISFIPEREYQRRIPDFPEDYGIIEDISYNPSILDMFDNSPSKDIRKNNDTDKPASIVNPNQPGVVDVEPNGLNIIKGNPQGQPVQDDIPHWQIPVTKPTEDTDMEFPQRQRPDNNAPHVEPTGTIPQPGINEYETKDMPMNNNVPFVNNVDHPILVTPGYENAYNPFVDNLDSEIPMVNDNPNQHETPIHHVPQNGEDEYYPETNRDVEHDSSVSNSNNHANPLNPADNPHIPYMNPVEDERNRYEPANIIPPPKTFRIPQKDKYGRIIGWTTLDPKNNWEKGRNMLPSYNPNYAGHGEVPSFDYWLKQQLTFTTLDGNRVPTSTSDIVALHAAIRNLLLQNGYVVTGHGTLTDGYGKVTSLTNLKLRPIFIGKSFSYNHFIQGGGSFKIPTDTPFLEGLLLTMIKPAKILGIVPLKITSLPYEFGPTNRHKLPISGQMHPVSQKATFKVLPIEDLVSFRKYSKKRRPRPYSSKKYKDAAFLQKAMLEISKPRKFGRVRANDLGNLEMGTVSEEKPDFRIIGGASATSSGTPLLFKGRSGLS